MYDLNAYEAVMPGLGRRIWESFVEEEKHLKEMDARREKLDKRRQFGMFGI